MATTTATTPVTPAPTAVHARPLSRKERINRLPRPKARGWIHSIITPLVLANGIVTFALADGTAQRVSVMVFAASALVLFGHSSFYHIGNWQGALGTFFRRLDHANIFLLIAGTYTPMSIMCLTPGRAGLVLGIVWGGALLGIILNVFWLDAPRWIGVSLYIALGWVAVWFLPDFWDTAGPAIVWLLIAGGLAYTIGAVCYATRWPNPWPRVFGFHEFFHAGTVGGYACHAVAVWLTMYAVR